MRRPNPVAVPSAAANSTSIESRKYRAMTPLLCSRLFRTFSVAVFLSCLGSALQVPVARAQTTPGASSPNGANSQLLRLPLRFEPTADGNLQTRVGRFAIQIGRAGEVSLASSHRHPIQISLAQANPVLPMGQELLPGKSNYFLGNKPSLWRHGIDQFAKARVPNVYPGIDLLYYGNGNELEHDYLLSPHADAGFIGMRFDGAATRIDPQSGDLLLVDSEPDQPAVADVRLRKPVAYQSNRDGSRSPVAVSYQLRTDGTIGFSLGGYDRSRALVIDPVITYSTYFGGSGLDSVADIKVDAQGNIYMLVSTTSTDLPVISQIPHACAGTCGPANPSTPDQSVISHDIYLAKLDPTGQQLLYSTWIGGSADDDPGSLTIASDGTIYIAGETRSNDFPLVNQYSSTLAPGQLYSTTLTRLSADGSSLLYSSLIGGGLYNQAPGQPDRAPSVAPNSVAAGPNGIAYLIGYADTADGGIGTFIDTKNSSFTQGIGTYVAKFDTTLAGRSSLLYAQTFGPPDAQVAEFLYGIALDSQQNVWVIGDSVGSPGSPTPNAVQPICDGGGQCNNVYLFELDLVGRTAYATYLGGTLNAYGGPGIESPRSISIDPADNIYIGGNTESIDFPTVNAAWTYATADHTHGTSFLTKLSPGALSILYSTYIAWNVAPVVMVAAPNGIAVSVEPAEGGYPIINGLPGGPTPSGGIDAAFEIFDTTKSGAASLLTSSYLGDKGPTYPLAATFDLQGNLLLGGYTNAPDLPLVNPYQRSCSGGCPTYFYDGFLSRISFAPSITLTPASLSFGTEPIGSTTSAQTATLSNSGSTAITFSTPTLSDTTDFAESDTCNGTVTTGGTCTFSFTFSPRSAGALSSTFSVTTTSPPTGTYSVSLSGTGAAPAATISPMSVAFGNVTVGSTSAAQVLTVSNPGATPVTPSSISTQGQFAIQGSGTSCAANVAISAGGSCTVAIVFTPTVAGASQGLLTVFLQGGLALNATFTGTGIAAAAPPPPSISPASLAFGNLTVGSTSAAQVLTISNPGTTALRPSGISTQGQYSIQGSGTTCAANVAIPAVGFCTIAVVFTPSVAGASQGLLTVFLQGGLALNATFTGTGIAAAAPPPPSISPASLAFGNLTVGSTSAAQVLTVSNPGTTPVTPSSISTQGQFAIQGSGTSCVANVAIPAGGSCTVAIVFMPTVAGASQGLLTVFPQGGLALNTTLSGTGVGSPSLSTVSALVARADGSYSVTLTVTNSGTGLAQSLVLSSLSIAGAVGTPTPQTLGDIAPGQSASVTVVVPASAGLPGTPTVERLTGTYTGGTFGSSLRTTLP